MVVFDASVLIDLFNPRLKGDRRAKLDYLVETLQKMRATIPQSMLKKIVGTLKKAMDPQSRQRIFKPVPTKR